MSETTVNNNDSDKLLNHFNLLNISTNVDALIHPPGVEILEEGEYKEFNDDYTNIRVYLVTPEMLVVTKTFSKRKRDLEDILNEDLLDLIDPKKTIRLIEEFKTYYIFADDPELNVSDILPKLKKWCTIKIITVIYDLEVSNMVEVNELLKDAQMQVKAFSGGRLKTAKLYTELLSNLTDSKVNLQQLLKDARVVETDKHTKADLMKMVKVNYNHFQNRDRVNQLMVESGLDVASFKPLSEVVVP